MIPIRLLARKVLCSPAFMITSRLSRSSLNSRLNIKEPFYPSVTFIESGKCLTTYFENGIMKLCKADLFVPECNKVLGTR